MKSLNNLLGAFGDAAILFPILILLNSKAGIPIVPLLVYTGLVYVFSALFYRLPMPVQPLKSIAMAAVSVGATFLEIRMASLLLGLFFVSLLLAGQKMETVLSRVPLILIHQLQVGLGVLLMIQAVKSVDGALVTPIEAVFGLGLMALLLVKSDWRGIPILGLVATTAFVLGLWQGQGQELNHTVSSVNGWNDSLRWSLVLGLVLPQIALTMGNSVLSTKIICEQLFPQQVQRVTFRRLLAVIGFGNIAMALLGGMPFCHGSGGLTAHYRAGARSWLSTALMGLILIVFATTMGNSGVVIPKQLLFILLATVGMYHLQLAKAHWQDSMGRWYLLGAMVVVAATKNLLWIFVVFAFIELFRWMEARFGFIR